jgi:hypothetical protein
METTDKRSLSPVEILRVAHEDGLRAYRDLSDFRITLVLEDDGWHVDYDLNKPGWCGGGPHYVIEPNTGAILSKRYEQ